MKRTLCAVLIAALMATPAFAAKVYLKEGGVIEARKVWRSGGKVHVWAQKDSMTSFDAAEIDLKKTFPKKRRAAKKPVAAVVAPQAAAPAPAGAAASQKPAEKKQVEKKPGIALPAIPKLPEKSPDSLVPSSGGGGTIKQHKKEMADKADQ